MSNNKTLKYKTYQGSVEASIEDECLIGEVLFIRDTIIYSANTMSEIKVAFEDAVDQYIKDCDRLGRPAQKPYTGNFNVRIGSERHKRLAMIAYSQGASMNKTLGDAVDMFFEQNNAKDESLWETNIPGVSTKAIGVSTPVMLSLVH